MSFNEVILVGFLGKNPEVRYTSAGKPVAQVSIATNRVYSNAAGEKQEKTYWHQIIFFNRLAEIAGEFLKKGSQVLIRGYLATRHYDDKDGKRVYVTEVIAETMQMLDRKSDGSSNSGAEFYANHPPEMPEASSVASSPVVSSSPSADASSGAQDIPPPLDDELPF